MLRGSTVLHEMAGDAAITHTQRLPADLVRTLDAAGLRLTDVDLFAVAAGPGSFTGIRVGIGTVQGLAMATGRRVVPVSTLDALGRAGANPSRPVAAWMDAQRGEVFAALYAPNGRDQLMASTNASPPATLEAWGARVTVGDATFIGDGAVRYGEVIRAAGAQARILAAPLLAGIIGTLAADDPARAVLPHAVVPIYIRRPDVELARARRSTGG